MFLPIRRKMTFSKFFPHDENQVCCIAQLINFVDEFLENPSKYMKLAILIDSNSSRLGYISVETSICIR